MQSPLPGDSLYGEQGLAADMDCLHCESIAERSRLHDWEIRPHRHERLFQLVWIERGRCSVSLDGHERTLDGPCVLLMPPGAVHGFRFEPQVEGQVLTVLAEHLHKLLAREPALAQRLLQPRTQAVDEAQARALAAAMQALRAEFASVRDWRAMGLDGALAQLLVVLGRCAFDEHGQASAAGGRAARHVQRFRALVEQRFRAQPALADCAAELGLTTTQLNRVCQQALGCSSIAVLHARLLLESQRELAYTTLSIKQIADGLGFSDAAYFTRFYQRKTGLTPSAWRRRSSQRA